MNEKFSDRMITVLEYIKEEALRLGFNWSMGPFEMLESIGLDNFFTKIGKIENKSVIVIGNEKGNTMETRIKHNLVWLNLRAIGRQ